MRLILIIIIFAITFITGCNQSELDELKADLSVHESNNPYETVDGDIEIWSQEMLDSIGNLGIRSIFGRLVINGYSIEDLSPLSTLEQVNALTIHKTNVSALSGLEKLKAINGTLDISGNPNLNDISTLDFLTSLEGSLLLTGNSSLTNLGGLQNIEVIKKGLTISNMSISSLKWFKNVKTVRALNLSSNKNLNDISDIENNLQDLLRLRIVDCPGINDLAIFKELDSLDYLDISYNDNLSGLQGLQNISYTRHLFIIKNKNLTSLEGLNSLATINTFSIIADNESLVSIEALKNLEGGDYYLWIQYNPNLKDFCPIKDLILNNEVSNLNVYKNSPEYDRSDLYSCPE